MLREIERSFSILLADSQKTDADLLEQLLAESDLDNVITRSSSTSETETFLRTKQFDIILIDLTLFGGRESCLSRLIEIAPQTPVIVLATLDDTMTGLKVLRNGAQEYLLKDQLTSPLLVRVIRYAIERQRILVEITRTQEELRQQRVKYEEQLLIGRKVESIVRLAGGIAHDFNNLIMAIQVNCEVLQLKLPDEFQDLPEISAILDSTMKGSVLTHQLLSFSRRQSLHPSLIEISGFMLAIKPLLEDLLGAEIECIVETLKDPCMIRADTNLLREVFIVIAENAKEAMKARGTFRIRTEIVEVDQVTANQWIGMEAGKYVKMDFSDNGIGMKEEVKNRLFEPYFTTKDIGHGKGLSLASVYGIVKQNKGYIYVDSEPQKGSTFHLYFPVAPEILK